jgi:hypothetical protein
MSRGHPARRAGELGLPRAAPWLCRKAHEAVHGEDMWLWRREIRGHDGRKEFLGRFKRMPVAPTILHSSPAASDGGW